MKGYNGWANYETWNVALWIGNDEGLYEAALQYANSRRPYRELVDELISYGLTETPDGVAWDSPSVRVRELNAMIAELG